MEQGLPVKGNLHIQDVIQGAEPDRRSQDRDLLVVHLEEEHLQEVGHPEVPDLDPIVQTAGPDPVVDTDPVLGRAGDVEQGQKLGQGEKVLLEPRSLEEMVTDLQGQQR